jgi:hypothetical protein
MNLSLQRVDLCNRDLLCDDLGSLALHLTMNPFGERGLLTEIIDGKRAGGLKDSSLPDLLLGDTACC